MWSLEILSKMALEKGRMVTLVRHDLNISRRRFLSNSMWLKKKKQPCHCFIFQCSVSCGRGHKQRNVYCMAKDGSHLESDYCKHLAKPNGHRKCRGGRCPKWKAGAWSQVSNASPLPLLPYPQPCGWHQPVGLCFSAQFWFSEGSLGTGREESLCQDTY